MDSTRLGLEGCIWAVFEYSDDCKKFGLCGYETDGCVATEIGCKKGKNCKETGNCGYNPVKRICMTTPKGCTKSKVCKEYGWCTPDESAQRCISGENKSVF